MSCVPVTPPVSVPLVMRPSSSGCSFRGAGRVPGAPRGTRQQSCPAESCVPTGHFRVYPRRHDGDEALPHPRGPAPAQGAADPRRAGHGRLRPDPRARLAATTVEAIAERATSRVARSAGTSPARRTPPWTSSAGTAPASTPCCGRGPADEPPLLAYRRRCATGWPTGTTRRGMCVPGCAGCWRWPTANPTCSPPTSASGSTPRRSRSDRRRPARDDDARDVRPAAVVDAAAGVLIAAMRLWARGDERDAGAQTSPPSWSGPTTP